MAKLKARLDRMVEKLGQEKVDSMAETIKAYLTAPAADPGNLEKLSEKLKTLAKRRETRYAANFANDNRLELDDELAIIEEVLRNAMRTLRMLPAGRIKPMTDASGFHAVVSEWLAYGAQSATPPRLTPSTHDIAVMERVINLILGIPDGTIRKVVMLKASGKSFRNLAKELHCSHEKVRQHYIAGLMYLAKTICGSVLTELTV